MLLVDWLSCKLVVHLLAASRYTTTTFLVNYCLAFHCMLISYLLQFLALLAYPRFLSLSKLFFTTDTECLLKRKLSLLKARLDSEITFLKFARVSISFTLINFQERNKAQLSVMFLPLLQVCASRHKTSVSSCLDEFFS